jgi:hypothetical protein
MEKEIETIGERLRTDTESIKLYKNSRGYNWEIKILETDIVRLKALNQIMQEQFANEE